MTIALHRERSPVAVTEPARHGRNISAVFGFFLAVVSPVGFAYLGNDLLELLARRGLNFSIRDFLSFNAPCRTGKNKAVAQRIFENRFHGAEFVGERLRGNFTAPAR